ncbi:hypothetical protein JCM8115_000148 [Rhodotorula mucilaginosa]
MAGRDDTSAIDADETVRLANLQAEDKDLLHGIVTVAGALTDLLRKNNGQDNEDVEDAKEEDGQAVNEVKDDDINMKVEANAFELEEDQLAYNGNELQLVRLLVEQPSLLRVFVCRESGLHGLVVMANLPRPPPKSSRDASINVWTVMKSLTLMQYLLFFSGWLAWTVDAIDFFSVSLSNTRLTTYFITLALRETARTGSALL